MATTRFVDFFPARSYDFGKSPSIAIDDVTGVVVAAHHSLMSGKCYYRSGIVSAGPAGTPIVEWNPSGSAPFPVSSASSPAVAIDSLTVAMACISNKSVYVTCARAIFSPPGALPHPQDDSIGNDPTVEVDESTDSEAEEYAALRSSSVPTPTLQFLYPPTAIANIPPLAGSIAADTSISTLSIALTHPVLIIAGVSLDGRITVVIGTLPLRTTLQPNVNGEPSPTAAPPFTATQIITSLPTGVAPTVSALANGLVALSWLSADVTTVSVVGAVGAPPVASDVPTAGIARGSPAGPPKTVITGQPAAPVAAPVPPQSTQGRAMWLAVGRLRLPLPSGDNIMLRSGPSQRSYNWRSSVDTASALQPTLELAAPSNVLRAVAHGAISLGLTLTQVVAVCVAEQAAAVGKVMAAVGLICPLGTVVGGAGSAGVEHQVAWTAAVEVASGGHPVVTRAGAGALLLLTVGRLAQLRVQFGDMLDGGRATLVTPPRARAAETTADADDTVGTVAEWRRMMVRWHRRRLPFSMTAQMAGVGQSTMGTLGWHPGWSEATHDCTDPSGARVVPLPLYDDYGPTDAGWYDAVPCRYSTQKGYGHSALNRRVHPHSNVVAALDEGDDGSHIIHRFHAQTGRYLGVSVVLRAGLLTALNLLRPPRSASGGIFDDDAPDAAYDVEGGGIAGVLWSHNMRYVAALGAPSPQLPLREGTGQAEVTLQVVDIVNLEIVGGGRDWGVGLAHNASEGVGLRMRSTMSNRAPAVPAYAAAARPFTPVRGTRGDEMHVATAVAAARGTGGLVDGAHTLAVGVPAPPGAHEAAARRRALRPDSVQWAAAMAPSGLADAAQARAGVPLPSAAPSRHGTATSRPAAGGPVPNTAAHKGPQARPTVPATAVRGDVGIPGAMRLGHVGAAAAPPATAAPQRTRLWRRVAAAARRAAHHAAPPRVPPTVMHAATMLAARAARGGKDAPWGARPYAYASAPTAPRRPLAATGPRGPHGPRDTVRGPARALSPRRRGGVHARAPHDGGEYMNEFATRHPTEAGVAADAPRGGGGGGGGAARRPAAGVAGHVPRARTSYMTGLSRVSEVAWSPGGDAIVFCGDGDVLLAIIRPPPADEDIGRRPVAATACACEIGGLLGIVGRRGAGVGGAVPPLGVCAQCGGTPEGTTLDDGLDVSQPAARERDGGREGGRCRVELRFVTTLNVTPAVPTAIPKDDEGDEYVGDIIHEDPQDGAVGEAPPADGAGGGGAAGDDIGADWDVVDLDADGATDVADVTFANSGGRVRSAASESWQRLGPAPGVHPPRGARVRAGTRRGAASAAARTRARSLLRAAAAEAEGVADDGLRGRAAVFGRAAGPHYTVAPPGRREPGGAGPPQGGWGAPQRRHAYDADLYRDAGTAAEANTGGLNRNAGYDAIVLEPSAEEGVEADGRGEGDEGEEGGLSGAADPHRASDGDDASSDASEGVTMYNDPPPLPSPGMPPAQSEFQTLFSECGRVLYVAHVDNAVAPRVAVPFVFSRQMPLPDYVAYDWVPQGGGPMSPWAPYAYCVAEDVLFALQRPRTEGRCLGAYVSPYGLFYLIVWQDRHQENLRILGYDCRGILDEAARVRMRLGAGDLRPPRVDPATFDGDDGASTALDEPMPCATLRPFEQPPGPSHQLPHGRLLTKHVSTSTRARELYHSATAVGWQWETWGVGFLAPHVFAFPLLHPAANATHAALLNIASFTLAPARVSSDDTAGRGTRSGLGRPMLRLPAATTWLTGGSQFGVRSIMAVLPDAADAASGGGWIPPGTAAHMGALDRSVAATRPRVAIPTTGRLVVEVVPPSQAEVYVVMLSYDITAWAAGVAAVMGAPPPAAAAGDGVAPRDSPFDVTDSAAAANPPEADAAGDAETAALVAAYADYEAAVFGVVDLAITAVVVGPPDGAPARAPDGWSTAAGGAGVSRDARESVGAVTVDMVGAKGGLLGAAEALQRPHPPRFTAPQTDALLAQLWAAADDTPTDETDGLAAAASGALGSGEQSRAAAVRRTRHECLRYRFALGAELTKLSQLSYVGDVTPFQTIGLDVWAPYEAAADVHAAAGTGGGPLTKAAIGCRSLRLPLASTARAVTDDDAEAIEHIARLAPQAPHIAPPRAGPLESADAFAPPPPPPGQPPGVPGREHRTVLFSAGSIHRAPTGAMRLANVGLAGPSAPRCELWRLPYVDAEGSDPAEGDPPWRAACAAIGGSAGVATVGGAKASPQFMPWDAADGLGYGDVTAPEDHYSRLRRRLRQVYGRMQAAGAVGAADPRAAWGHRGGQLLAVLSTATAGLSLAARFDMPRVVYTTLPGADGLPCDATLIVPRSGLDDGVRRPVLMMVYGGPNIPTVSSSCILQQWCGPLVPLVSCADYVLVYFEPRGQRGMKVGCDAIYETMGVGQAEDVAAAVRRLQRETWVDPDRIALCGWSYGGYLTLMGITTPLTSPMAPPDFITLPDGRPVPIQPPVVPPSRNPDGVAAAFDALTPAPVDEPPPDAPIEKLFNCAVSIAGVGDFRTACAEYGERYIGLPIERVIQHQRTCVLDRLYRLRRRSCELMLVHGMCDNQVLFQQNLIITQRLCLLGIPYEHRVYPNKQHSLYGPLAHRHVMSTVAEFVIARNARQTVAQSASKWVAAQ